MTDEIPCQSCMYKYEAVEIAGYCFDCFNHNKWVADDEHAKNQGQSTIHSRDSHDTDNNRMDN